MAALRAALATFVVGGLLGFVLSALATPIVEGSTLFGGTGESPQARTYMVSLIQSDPDQLAQLTPGRGVASRASQYRSTTETAGSFRPVSLTYLGGRSQGRLTVQIYALELQPPRGPVRFLPLALTLIDGKVVRRE